jgi:hypothetical protein
MRGLPRLRLRLTPTTLALLVLFAIPIGSGAASAQTRAGNTTGAAASVPSHRPATKVVRYHGYRLVVPASWPVYDLASNPTTCVRFNRHAVYLGQPGARQQCPAHAAGRTEAILVAPLAARGAGARGTAGPALAPVQGSSAELAIPSSGVQVTATWRGDPAVVARALGVR